MHPEEAEENKTALTIMERRQLDACDGWMMLGDPVEAERELNEIPAERAAIPEVFSKRWMLYDAAGWKKKRDALCPVIRKPLGKTLLRFYRALGGLCVALIRDRWNRFRGIPGENK